MELGRELSALFASQVVGVAILDRELRYVGVNQTMARIHHRPAEAHPGRSIPEVVRYGADRLQELAAQVHRTRKAVFGIPHEAHGIHVVVDCLPLDDGLLVLVADATPLVAAERELLARLRVSELIAELCAGFIDLPASEIDAGIDLALEGLCRGLDLDRVYLAEINGTWFRFTHEWSRGALPPIVSIGRPWPASEFAWVTGLVFEGKTFSMERIDDLPPEARARVAPTGTCAIAAVPLVAAGKARGFLAASSATNRAWSTEDLTCLRVAADIFAGALERRDAHRELVRLKAAVEHERDYLREELRQEFSEIVGGSEALRRALDSVDAVAGTDATVLIRGESGVGKELFARAIHARSARREGPLVKVNCASIPRDLFESEFFGHVRGAFTGAHKDRVGRFELADGGTLLLDEVGDIPLEQQAKLLRVLQEREFERVGDDRTRRVDVRVLAATNRNLEDDVAAGRFRRDLYYRLGVFPLDVPSLRERRADVVPLAEHYLASYAARLGRSGLVLSPEQAQRLTDYDWPGNIRELQHVIERAVILSRTPPLRIDLPGAAPRPSSAPARQVLQERDLKALERDNIVAALARAQGRVAGRGGAADLLGVSPSTLRDRMKAMGLHRQSSRSHGPPRP